MPLRHALLGLKRIVVTNISKSAGSAPTSSSQGCLLAGLTGTDGWSRDAPFVHTRERYEATGNAGLIWEGHKAGRDIGYCHLEKLHNLEVLPPTGFMISCFPVKIRDASAGWTRAVAIFEA